MPFYKMGLEIVKEESQSGMLASGSSVNRYAQTSLSATPAATTTSISAVSRDIAVCDARFARMGCPLPSSLATLVLPAPARYCKP